MLEILCQKNDLWLKMAYEICRSKELSKDLVQDMYLKLHKYQKELNDGYIYFTIKSIFLNQLKKNKEDLAEEYIFINIINEDYNHEIDNDFELKLDKINQAYQKLAPLKKIVVEYSYEDGLRPFARESGIGINTVHRYRNEFKNLL